MQTQSTLIGIIISIIIFSSIAANDLSSYEQSFDFPDACQAGFRTGNWKDCANSLSTLIWNTHTWYNDQPIIICKLKCTRTLKGRVSNFQWVWDAKFECGEQAPGMIGEARGFKTRRNAMKHAIAQTIEQSITYGKLTPNDFKCD
jgi:hypothetical protein